MNLKRWLILGLFCLVFSLQLDAASAAKGPRTSNTPPKSAAPSSTDNQGAEKSDGRIPINPPEFALIKQDHVNVRGQPSLVGEVITRLRKGEPVTLLEEITVKKNKTDEPSRWYQIALPTNTPVWVNAEFVDAVSKTVKPRRLNVRAGPGENYSVIARLEKGTEIKEIRKVNNWMEIEAPTNAYAFVAAEFIAKQAPTALPVNPTPAPEIAIAPPIAVVPGTPTQSAATNVATNNVSVVTATKTPSEPAPAPLETLLPSAATNAVAPGESSATEPLPKRVVTREGIVRRAVSIQAPTYFEMISGETGKVINYLNAEQHKEYDLKLYTGFKVIVTGEELMDPRWPRTPVVQIETLDLP